MILELYKTIDDNNIINKTLTDMISYEIKLKDNVDIISPTIILSSETLLVNFNYAYIPDFGRYYFINSVSINSKNVYVLSLECDVLESFKDDILNSYAYISKAEDGNNYYNSNNESEVRKEVNIYHSNVTINKENSNIIIINGKGV